MDHLSLFPFWEQLTETQKQYLKEHSRTLCYQPGQLVHNADSDCLGIFLVVSGSLRAYLSGKEGRQATIYQITAGKTCVLSASCILSAIRFEVQIEAEKESTILLIPSSAFASVMQQNLYLENYVYRSATEHFSDIIDAVERILFLSLEARVATFLLNQSKLQQSSQLYFTQEEIAHSIGSAREAVSRILKQFSKRQLIEVSRGKVELLNQQELTILLES